MVGAMDPRSELHLSCPNNLRWPMNDFNLVKAEDDFAALILRYEDLEMPLEDMCRSVERGLRSLLEDI